VESEGGEHAARLIEVGQSAIQMLF
jgi:hypothetical protein